MDSKFKIAKGTRDFLPKETSEKNYVETTIKNIFERFGFQQIQTPIFEKFELFSTRSGPEIREGMFTFFCDSEEFALRPELTAAVCRLISTGKLNIPKPYEIFYIGPCFRYERPQSGRYREFTQAGVEIMGTSSTMADAKIIATAISVLEELQIKDYQVKIGNIGIFRSLLQKEGFDFNQQCSIIGLINKYLDTREKLSVLSKKDPLEQSDKDFLVTKMSEVYKIQGDMNYKGKYEIIPIPSERLDKDKIRTLFKEVPEAMEETMRFILKNDYKIKNELLDLFFKIGKIQGERKEVEKEADKLLKNTAAEEAVKELFLTLDSLENYGCKNYEVVLGVARGLDFYTGTVFEIDLPILDAQKQVCGGGRYDNLVAEFGGPKTPATGFAFGVDRLIEGLKRSSKLPEPTKADFFIIPISNEFKKEALEITSKLRKKGLRCEEELEEINFKKQIENAQKLKIPCIILIGKKEIESKKFTVTNLNTDKKTEISMEEINKEMVF